MRVDIVPYLAPALTFRQQHYQTVDGGLKRHARAGALPDQRNHLWIPLQKLELRQEREP